MMAVSSAAFRSGALSGSAPTLLAPACGDSGLNTSARSKFTNHRGRDRLAGLHHIAQEFVHYVLIEDAEVSIFEFVHLKRFQLETQFVRHIAKRQLAESGSPVFGQMEVNSGITISIS